MTGDAGVPPPTEPTEQPNAMYDGSTPLRPILDALDIPRPRPVLVVVGWAATPWDAATRDGLELFLRKVVAPICRDEDAVVISGGTNVGIMAALGTAIAEEAPSVTLVGVAPDAKLIGFGADASVHDAARPEPRHRLIRTPGDAWGNEGPSLVRVAEYIAGDRNVVVLAIGGGDIAQTELALAARRCWPSILVTGHGGTSEHIAASLTVNDLSGNCHVEAHEVESGRQVARSALDVKRRKREISDLEAANAAGYLVAAPLEDRYSLERALRWRLHDAEVLKDAWSRFSVADALATSQKQPTRRLAVGVVILATLTVLCATGSTWLATRTDQSGTWAWADDALKMCVTAFPLAAAALIGLINRRARTGAWIDMRAAGESVIQAIYRYRAWQAGAGVNNSGASRDGHPEAPPPTQTPASLSPQNVARETLDASFVSLEDVVAGIDTRTKGWSLLPVKRGTNARTLWPPTALAQRVPMLDSLVGPLTAADYDEARVLDQLEHYEDAARRLSRRATRLAALVFAVAGVAAFLLALSWKWSYLAAVAVAPASLLAALVTWREYRQRDARTDAMLSTCVSVRAARGRWLALGVDERNAPGGLAQFVNEVEDALAAEGADWERDLRAAQERLVRRYP